MSNTAALTDKHILLVRIGAVRAKSWRGGIWIVTNGARSVHAHRARAFRYNHSGIDGTLIEAVHFAQLTLAANALPFAAYKPPKLPTSV